MLPRADRSAISCIKSSNSLIRASLYVNSGAVLLSCFNIVASRDLLPLVQRARTDKNDTYLVRSSMLHSIQKSASPARPHIPHQLMGRAQRSYNHRHHAQSEGYVKGQVYSMQEECQGRRELAHPTAINEDLHHRCHGDRTQGEWEDNGNAEQ